MGFIQRASFARGWVPDADLVGGPIDGLLRMDNLVLDELGALALRRGSSKLNASALADLDVHSLYTAILSGTRYRLTGAGSAVYVNGTSLVTGMDGDGDIAFGSHLGHAFFARGATKKKYDGTTVRNWGIAQTGAAPTVATADPDGKTFAVCDGQESPQWVINEDDGTGLTFGTGQDGTANGSLILHPKPSTGRVTATRTFTIPMNFTTYDAGAGGTDDDLLRFYIYVTEPAALRSVRVMVDVNPNSINAFQDDYYVHDFAPGEAQALGPTEGSPLAPAFGVQSADRNRIGTVFAGRFGHPPVSTLRTDLPIANAGWSTVAVRRGDMIRTGSTNGCDWTTATAIRLVVEAAPTTPVAFDLIRMTSNPMNGQYKWCYCLARNTGRYVALSAPSALTAATQISAQAANVTIPLDLTRDSQVNECWLFRMGGVLDAFYRVAVKSNLDGTAAFTIMDNRSDLDALIINEKLQTDNAPPPDDILDVEGPYYDRMFVLTATTLYPSRRINPESFSAGQAISVAGTDETALWIKRAFGGLYVGTTKDIYRIEGTLAEQPDGTIDVQKTPLNVAHSPVADGVAHDGNLLLYIGSDGWQSVAGIAEQSIAGATSLLYYGRTRYGVSPINLESGRFRAAIANGQLVALVPEGDDTASSTVLYRYVPARSCWYRHTYPQALRIVYGEPDGTLLAGDTNGFVWQLDSGTNDDGTDIPIVLWTKADDGGDAFHQKQLANLHLNLETGGSSLTAAVHLDGSDDAAVSTTVSASARETALVDLSSAENCLQAQVRLSGSCDSFHLTALGFTAHPVALGVLAWDSGPLDLKGPELIWIRGLQIKAAAAAPLTVRVYFDGQLKDTRTVTFDTQGTDAPTTQNVWFEKGVKGRVPRVIITSTSRFRPFWVEFLERGTGAASDKGRYRIPAEAA